jgi:hypothetical protein
LTVHTREAWESTDHSASLEQLHTLTRGEQLARLADYSSRMVAGDHLAEFDQPTTEQIVTTMVDLLQGGEGNSTERLTIGAALGMLGDPRLRAPEDSGYWADVHQEDGIVQFGRFMVTNAEFRKFVEAGGYDEPSHWGEQGALWLQSDRRRWPELAISEESRPFIVANQPVVGVTWFEATAYANWAKSRLPRFDERLRAIRGVERRPYPWGSPFGEGNANTQEEVLGRPCAVGLYVRDRSPEGVYDLAGNVAEWCGDGVGEQQWVHPGAWNEPSMAAWAKARMLETPDQWSPALGFRLARD